MIYLVGVENMGEERSMARALEHPGCFAYGTTDEDALAALPEAIRSYAEWIASRADQSWLTTDEMVLQEEVSFQVFMSDEAFFEGVYALRAWYRQDWQPLSEVEVERGLLLLKWSRTDLLALFDNLSQEAFHTTQSGERWSIKGILEHLANAEATYLNRLGIELPRERPLDIFAYLYLVRACLVEVLPTLADSRRVIGVDGEFWNPRKLLHRAVWHERDHTQHIQKLIQGDKP